MSMRRSLLLPALIAGCVAPTPVPPPAAPKPPVAVVAPAPPPEPAPAPACLRVASIRVEKAKRRLTARCEAGAVHSFTVSLGRRAEGPKLRAGDWRTPEGAYRLLAPVEHERFHLFIPFDYPGVHDADRALAEGRLDAAAHARILAAHREGALPPQDTALGGALGLHGEGADWRGDSAVYDWTYGCIALADPDIDFLAERAPPGTPIELVP